MKLISMPLSILVFIGVATAGEPAAGTEETPATTEPSAAASEQPDPERCVMGGFTIGQGILDKELKDRSKFKRDKPDLVEIPLCDSYTHLGPHQRDFNEFVIVCSGTLLMIIREYDGAKEQQLLLALREKYGVPDIAPLVPKVKSTYAGFGGGIAVVSEALWVDKACGTTVELFQHTKTTIAPFYAGTHNRLAVVVKASAKKAKDDKDPLLE